jgi:hypothetical protein
VIVEAGWHPLDRYRGMQAHGRDHETLYDTGPGAQARGTLLSDVVVRDELTLSDAIQTGVFLVEFGPGFSSLTNFTHGNSLNVASREGGPLLLRLVRQWVAMLEAGIGSRPGYAAD